MNSLFITWNYTNPNTPSTFPTTPLIITINTQMFATPPPTLNSELLVSNLQSNSFVLTPQLQTTSSVPIIIDDEEEENVIDLESDLESEITEEELLEQQPWNEIPAPRTYEEKMLWIEERILEILQARIYGYVPNVVLPHLDNNEWQRFKNENNHATAKPHYRKIKVNNETRLEQWERFRFNVEKQIIPHSSNNNGSTNPWNVSRTYFVQLPNGHYEEYKCSLTWITFYRWNRWSQVHCNFRFKAEKWSYNMATNTWEWMRI